MPWKQPYRPPEPGRPTVLLCLGAGVFVARSFQPFGISRWQGPLKALWLAGYGLITAAVLLVNHVLLPRVFKSFFREENFTVGRNVAFTLWQFVSIGKFCYDWLVFGQRPFPAISGHSGLAADEPLPPEIQPPVGAATRPASRRSGTDSPAASPSRAAMATKAPW